MDRFGRRRFLIRSLRPNPVGAGALSHANPDEIQRRTFLGKNGAHSRHNSRQELSTFCRARARARLLLLRCAAKRLATECRA